MVKKFFTHNDSFKVDIDTHFYLDVPRNLHSQKEWPLLIYLHGAGERGKNRADISHTIADISNDGRFIYLTPQVLEHNYIWQPTHIASIVVTIARNLPVDISRIYLTGFSMGGRGTWDTAAAYPNMFAAIAPVAGVSCRLFADRIKHIPSLVFHGKDDNIVPISESEMMVNALSALKADTNLITLEDCNHSIHNLVYSSNSIYDWFLKYKRN